MRIRAAPALLTLPSPAPIPTPGMPTTPQATSTPQSTTTTTTTTGPAYRTHRRRLPPFRAPTCATNRLRFPMVITVMRRIRTTAFLRPQLRRLRTPLRLTPAALVSIGRASIRTLTHQRPPTPSTDRMTLTTDSLSRPTHHPRPPVMTARSTHSRSQRTAATPSSPRWAWTRADSTGNAEEIFPRKPRRSSKPGLPVTATLRTPPRTKRSNCAGRRSFP